MPGSGAQQPARVSSGARAAHPTGPCVRLLRLVPAFGLRTGQPGEFHVGRSPASPGRALGQRAEVGPEGRVPGWGGSRVGAGAPAGEVGGDRLGGGL